MSEQKYSVEKMEKINKPFLEYRSHTHLNFLDVKTLVFNNKRNLDYPKNAMHFFGVNNHLSFLDGNKLLKGGLRK